MQVKNQHNKYSEYKTVRQWAKAGFLPKEGATGIELWANQNCQDSYTYYAPEEVTAATKEDLAIFFKPERDRKNERARKRRLINAVDREKQRQRTKQDEIAKILEPYIKTINEQHKSVGKKKIYVLDTETTGLNPDTDELLQISIIDFNGKTIFNSYIKPIASEWKKAEQINGITPEMVKNSPSVADVMTDINLIFSQADIIIGYNTSFDLSFLRAFGLVLIDNITIIDVMELFAPIYGEWNESYGQYKWQKLTKCAAYYEYDWGNDKAHNSLSDCRATLFCYNQIVKEKDCGE